MVSVLNSGFAKFDTSRSDRAGEAAPVNSRDHVIILLALLDGAATLQEQLDSLIDQTHTNWSLIVSDDGSTDDGPDMIRAFARNHPEHTVTLCKGPRLGFAGNFLHLLRQVPDGTAFVSFCDQDDVWLPQKTALAIETLSKSKAGIPAMYCGRTLHCDATLAPLRISPRFSRAPDFRNALLQNIGGGNTIVLNAAAITLLRAVSRKVESVVSHDWWAYQMITGVGGVVHYETRPGVYYRQHAGNAVGANGTARGMIHRVHAVIRGRYRDWNEENLAALGVASEYLTPSNREVLSGFRAARDAGFPRRMIELWRLRLYRQSRRGNLAFWIAAALGRV